MTPALDPEHQRILDRFPPDLRALVLAELEAGNAVIDAGAGHPAPPVGDIIKLANDLSTPLPGTLRAQVRNGSMCHMEITDADRIFFILTAPHPPPPLPDMDAIREAHRDAPLPVSEPMRMPGTIEMDLRGEMLLYREDERCTDIIWTWNGGHRLHPDTLTQWWYPATRRSVPLTGTEKAALMQRFLAYARSFISASIEVADG